jgi:hypothetical protein
MWKRKRRVVEWLLLRFESITVFAALSWALVWARTRPESDQKR